MPTVLPTCPTCRNEAIENIALGKTFFYCRTCKMEVDPLDSLAIQDHDYPPNSIEWEIYQDANGFPQWRVKQ